MFSAEIRAELDLSHSGFAAYYSLGTIAGAIILFWAGHWIDHMPLHLYTGATLAGLAVAGFVLAAVAWTGMVAVRLLFAAVLWPGLVISHLRDLDGPLVRP